MPKVTYIQPDGVTRVVDVRAGTTAMEAAVDNDVAGIVAECGGACSCATCHVYVDEGFLGKLDPIEGEEEVMLQSTAADRKPNSRLSCQLRLRPDLDGITVTMPDAQ